MLVSVNGPTVPPPGSRLLEEVSKLLELSRDVTSTLDLQQVLDRSFAALHRLISFGGGSIQLIRDGALILAATEPPATAEALTVRIPLGEGVGGQIVATGESTYIPDILADARTHPTGLAKATSPGVRCFLGSPLIVGGEPIGLIQVDSPRVDAFAPEARALVLAFVPTIAAAVQNAMLYAREQQTIEELRELERLKHNFLATVSHELRTPLVPIRGFAETLAERADRIDPAMVSDFARRILRASARLERLVEDLLDLSRIERSALRVNLVPTDLAPILDEALQLVRSSHDVDLDVQPELPPILVDPDRFFQVLLNILDNARKFSPLGSRIAVLVRREGDLVAVGVTDHGRGIPRQILPRVFERFFQAEAPETRTAGGLGLGLPLVRELCDAMGARVDVESEVGRGSTFTLRLAAVSHARPLR